MQHQMVISVKKWGNSMGVRLPKKLIQKMHLSEGDSLLASLQKNTIVLSKDSKNDLVKMCEGISKKNRHEDLLATTPRGNEVW